MTTASPTPLQIREDANGISFAVHVQPRASKNELCGVVNGAIRIRLTSPPVDDAANKLCTAFFADLLGVAKSNVSILNGARSRHKTIRVCGVTADDLTMRLPHSA